MYSDLPTTAFVDQTPWVQNGTIQDNILGISSFEEAWYSQVIHACALEVDIANFPRGHGVLIRAISSSDLLTHLLTATPVGSAGISLSGGQKQRLALARAVYAKKELVILDDVFSGLDSETEEQVFDRLFGVAGLFRKMKTTVLLVTHAVHRLPYSDCKYFLDRIGHKSSISWAFDIGRFMEKSDIYISTTTR